MLSDASESKSEPIDDAWREIDALVEEIAELSKSDLPSIEFFRELLDRVVAGLAAVGGVVWTKQRGGQLHPEYQTNLAETRLEENADDRWCHYQLVESVLQTGKGRLVAPRSGPAVENRTQNPTEFLLVLCPWRADDLSAGVLEVFQRPGTSPAAQRGYLQFLSLIGELVVDYYRTRQLDRFRQRMTQWGRFEQYAEQVHGSLDLQTIAYQIANEGRRLIGCDRVSVLIERGSRCRLLAISGVDTFNRRANVVGRLERLATAVTAVDEPLWHDERPEERPPAIEEALNAYLDEAHVRVLGVIPLKANAGRQDAGREGSGRSSRLGALVVERFQGGLDDDMLAGTGAARKHAALAIQNALELQSVPLLRPLKVLGKARWFVRAKQLPKTIIVLLAAVAAAIALAVVPADFEVEARGELQPLERRDVFAPSDAVVSDLRAAHAKPVRAGDVLLLLRRPELDLEFQRVWGELQTARKQLSTVEAQRLQDSRENTNDWRHHDQRTADEEELKELVRSLQRQYEIVQQQRSELQVRSPIDGEVLTWNLAQLLESRPVQRGQILMSVAQQEGPWVLELQVPDDRIAYVLAAQEQFGSELGVSFILATEPGVTYGGKIEKVAVRTEITESDEPIVLVTVGIDREEIAELMPGATVLARIYCGRRSIGYVWLHDLIEAARRWIMF